MRDYTLYTLYTLVRRPSELRVDYVDRVRMQAISVRNPPLLVNCALQYN